MLVLTRRINESIVIDSDIVITVLEVGRNGQVRIGIDAPRHHQVYRRELWLEIQRENCEALTSAGSSNAIDLGIPPKGPAQVTGTVVSDKPSSSPPPPIGT